VKSDNRHWVSYVAVTRTKAGKCYCTVIYLTRYKVFVGKPEGKRPLGRPRRGWEDGNIMDLREIGLGGVDWIRLAQDRHWWRAVVSAVMNLRVLAPRS
jgi:hypothetical protein